MQRPSLRANPIMGLTSARSRLSDVLASHHHVYFSDLRDVTTAGMTLTSRLFYGCWVAPETFAGAKLLGTEFVCCAGAGEPPSDAEVLRAIAESGRGDWEQMLGLLRKPELLAPGTMAPDAVEHLLAVAAVAMTDARWDLRLSTMTLIGHLLRSYPALLPSDARQVLEAFLLYRTADDSDMVYYDAIALARELSMPPVVLEHVVIERARSHDPQERFEALVARNQMDKKYDHVELPQPPLRELLDDSDPDVQLALLEYLNQNVRDQAAADDLLPGVDLPAKLNPLLNSRDDRVRRAALRWAWAVGGSANREAFCEFLRDPDEAIRDVAFKTLCARLPIEDFRDFLLHHQVTPTQREMVLKHEKQWREQYPGSGYLADPDELHEMLSSEEPRRRRDALLLAQFMGDPARIPDAEAALRDPDQRVRAEAERLLQQLRAIAPGDENIPPDK